VETVKNHPEIEFRFFTPHRMSIDMARNQSAVMALQTESDYLMFIDDDVLIPSNTMDLLLKANKDVVAGLVMIRGYPFNVMTFRWENPEEENLVLRRLTNYNDIPLIESCTEGHDRFKLDCIKCRTEGKLQEVVDCIAVGFSCCLINTDVLKPLEPPYFLTSKFHTEDIYFCLKLQGLDPIPSVAFHTGVKCGHLLNPEPIEWANRAVMKDLYAPIAERNFKRGQEWIDQCLTALNAPK